MAERNENISTRLELETELAEKDIAFFDVRKEVLRKDRGNGVHESTDHKTDAHENERRLIMLEKEFQNSFQRTLFGFRASRARHAWLFRH